MDEKPGVVFDTSIVLQAALRPLGPAGRLVSLVDRNLLTLFLSEPNVEEFADVLRRPAIRAKNPHLTEDLALAIMDRILLYGVLVSDVPAHFTYARDPDDEHIINLAIEAGAQFLVSRDKDLLELMNDTGFRDRFPNLTVVDPVAFLRELTSNQPGGEESVG